MRISGPSLLAGVLFAGLLFAAPLAPRKESSLRCTLTNKVVEKCCCEQREGKTYCPLAKKSVDRCCCEPADSPKPKK